VSRRQHLSALTEDTPGPEAHEPEDQEPDAPEPEDHGGGPREDPLRRIALIATAVLLPVVVALAVLANVLGGSDEPDTGSGAAEVEGGTTTGREDLPVLPVEVPPVTPEADASCPALMSTLPLELGGEPSRRVQSDSPYAYAWGDPAVVLICGVDRPAGFVVGVSAIQINGVQWYVDTSDPDTTVWTTVDRPVYVQISLPASVDSAPVTALTPQIAQAFPYREPDPAP
jgi:hypothetical protein